MTMLTTANSITEIVTAYDNVLYPERPVRPSLLSLGDNLSPQDYRTYATRLEEYERLNAEYNVKRKEFQTERNWLGNLFMEKLFSESSLKRPVFDVVYSKAHDDTSSGGLYEVAAEFERLESFAEKILSAK